LTECTKDEEGKEKPMGRGKEEEKKEKETKKKEKNKNKRGYFPWKQKDGKIERSIGNDLRLGNGGEKNSPKVKITEEII